MGDVSVKSIDWSPRKAAWGNGAHVPVATSLMSETSMRSGRSSIPVLITNLTALSQKWRYFKL